MGNTAPEAAQSWPSVIDASLAAWLLLSAVSAVYVAFDARRSNPDEPRHGVHASCIAALLGGDVAFYSYWFLRGLSAQRMARCRQAEASWGGLLIAGSFGDLTMKSRKTIAPMRSTMHIQSQTLDTKSHR